MEARLDSRASCLGDELDWGQCPLLTAQSGHSRCASYETDIIVYDNGKDMLANVLKVATFFGGSMSNGNRKGIGRFGMGIKTAALNISPVLAPCSWQEPNAFYSMTLDTNEIGRDKSNLEIARCDRGGV